MSASQELITHVPSAEELNARYGYDPEVTVPRGEAEQSYQFTKQGSEVIDLALRPDFIDQSELLSTDKLSEASQRFADKLAATPTPENANTSELFQYLPITKGISIRGQEFYLSDVVSANGRKHCVGYVELEDGNIAPRMFYKSNSDGDWRVSPQFYIEQDEAGEESRTYSKGEEMEYGYVRETRLHDDLSATLRSNESLTREWTPSSIKWLTEHFTADKLGSTFTYPEEVSFGKLRDTKDIYSLVPGHGFTSPDGRKASEVFSGAVITEMHYPDFSKQPSFFSESEHPILGNVQTEVFNNQSGSLAWHLSRDKEGRVWVSGVTSYNGQPNSYGTDYDVASAGIYDNKPVEYNSQVDGLEAGKDFRPTARNGYVDITPLLDNLPIIKDYRNARQIARIAA